MVFIGLVNMLAVFAGLVDLMAGFAILSSVICIV